MSANVDIREGMAEAFNVLSEEFIDGVTVTLCKASGDYNEFDTVLVLSTNRFFEYREDRQKVALEIADDSTELTEAIQAATHIKIDDDVYAIQTGDTLAPKSTDVTWKLFGRRNDADYSDV